MDIRDYIGSVLNFPKEGVDFKDITLLLRNPKAFQHVVKSMSEFVEAQNASVIVAPEARGFLFASAVAFHSGLPLVLVRKPGKLPREVHQIEYSLEYGSATQEMHKGDLKKDDRVVIIDDILATGGTIQAIIEMIEREGASLVGLSFLADLTYLHPKELFKEYPTQCFASYDE